MTPQDRSQVARYAEDITVAGLHVLGRGAKRRDDQDLLAALRRSHDWLLDVIVRELRAPRAW